MDKEYWIEYYKKEITPLEPSKFAIDIVNNFEKGKHLLELGCGNGRDSVFFGKRGINVLAIDQASSAINKLNEHNYENVIFAADNFVNSSLLEDEAFDYVYSRFVLHSITDEEQKIVLRNSYRALKSKGLLCIEVRSVKDDIYGLGEEIGHNKYVYNGHSRRFIVMKELISELEEIGFKVIFSIEGKKFCCIQTRKSYSNTYYSKKRLIIILKK